MKLQRSRCKAGLMGTGALEMGISGRRILSVSASLCHCGTLNTVYHFPPCHLAGSLLP